MAYLLYLNKRAFAIWFNKRQAAMAYLLYLNKRAFAIWFNKRQAAMAYLLYLLATRLCTYSLCSKGAIIQLALF